MLKNLLKSSLVSGLLITQVSAIEFVHVLEQGYWYSRYNLGELVMKSGNGETFMPDMAMVGTMLDMVSDDLSRAMPPQNPALLKRVYNKGNPLFITASNGQMMDFSDSRWERTDSENELTSYEAFAWTVTKEVEWSKQFNVDSHFGSPRGLPVPGAQERFNGVVLCAEALMQTMEFMQNPAAFAPADNSGKAAALIAIADFAQYIATPTARNMKNNRCAQAASMMAMKPASQISSEFLMFATPLYEELKQANLESVKDKSLAIQAFTWFGYANPVKAEEARGLIRNLGRDLTRVTTTDALEQAYIVKGLNDSARITKNAALTRAFEQSVTKLISLFNTESGIFNGKNSYSTDDVAIILGAINAAKLFSNQEEVVTPVFVKFFDTIFNQAGMQLSAPGVESIAQYERKPDSRMHRAEELPLPRVAGGSFGIAPVYAANVEFGANGITKTHDQFDSAGAMHLANQMIWFHNSEVNGFPEF